MENNGDLSLRQDRAIAALLNCRTIQDAAIELDISERSIYRWLQDEDFKFALRQARRETLRRATIRLQQIAGNAVDTLNSVMDNHDDKSTSASRVSAARTALDYAYRAVELEDLDERVATLEQVQQQPQLT